MLIIRELEGNGDFRSPECKRYLEEADIVITNPPFSLFREYVAQLMEYGKKFIIIGNGNAVIDKDIFPLVKNNEIWFGVTMKGCQQSVFVVPKHIVDTNTKERYCDGKLKYSTIINTAAWFTNIPHKIRNEELDLYKHYNEKEYPKYDNYNAIEVSKVDSIPLDYNGVMGVPFSFIGKYCPNQFEIIGLLADKRNENPVFIQGTPTYVDEKHKKYVGAVLNGKATYARILIKRKC